MKFQNLFLSPRSTRLSAGGLLLLACFLSLSSCHSERGKEQKTPVALSAELNQSLELKPGVEITIELAKPESQNWLQPKPQKRKLQILQVGGTAGISMTWQNEGAEDSDEQSGKLELPNFFQARMMTLPIFWSPGEMYLSHSSGIWLSDVAYEELKKSQASAWESGLSQNAILGPIQEIPALQSAVQSLEPWLAAQAKNSGSLRIVEKSSYALVLNGKMTSVPAVIADTWLGRFWILDHPTNPLILQFELAPGASVSDWLWTNLPLIKNVAEYRVVEFRSSR